MSEQREASRLSESVESAFADLIAEITDQLQAGAAVDLEPYIARHPEWADRLREMLPALAVMAEMGTSGAAGQRNETEPVRGTLGDFRIVREVGRGGMGIVYEAEQISLDRRVALKVLPFAATMDARQLQRFQNEARAAAGLHHTNIVPVYYVGSERGVHYYAMQYIEGRDLASVIAQLREQSSGKIYDSRHLATVDAAAGEAVTPSVSPAAATKPLAGLSTERSTKSAEHFRAVARLGIQAAEAVDHAHQMGIVHRDVKPANLLVDDAGRLWVTDFGLAQMQSDTRLTMTGDLVGTLRYMSPEQALAKRVVVDHRTDIYSLGATLYELLTLEPVFDGHDRQELLRQIAFEEPQPLRRLNKAIPAELETIVLKAMEKNPADRYASAQDVADDLGRFLENRPIQARPPSAAQRLAKWVHRHRSAVTAAVGFLVLAEIVLAGSVAIIAAAYQSESHQRLLAEKAKDQEAKQRGVAENARDLAKLRLHTANIHLAQLDLESGDIAQALAYLNANSPELGQPDLRGWEWYYLHALCHREVFTYSGPLSGYEHCIQVAAWSPDGTRLASGGVKGDQQGTFNPWKDGTVKIWEAKTWNELRTLRLPDGAVTALAWSPDGNRLASASHYPSDSRAGGRDLGEAKVWDVTTGKELFTFRGHTGAISSVAFSPDGRLLATASNDMTVKVWDSTTGNEVCTLKGHTKDIASVAFSPDSQRIATGSGDGTARVWFVATGKQLGTFPFHPSLRNYKDSLAWNHDGTLLALPAGGSSIKIWNVATGREVLTLLGHDNSAPVVWSPDGRRLASAGLNRTIKVWNTKNGQEPLTLPGHSGLVYSVAWSSEGDRLASASSDRTIKIWDANSGQEILTLRGHEDEVNWVSWAAGDRQLVSIDSKGTLKVWDALNDQKALTLNAANSVTSLAWSPDGKHLASTCAEHFRRNNTPHLVQVWDATNGKEELMLSMGSASGAVAWSPDSKRLAAIEQPSRFVVWDATRGKEVANVPGDAGASDNSDLFAAGAPGDVGALDQLTWSPDGSRIAAVVIHHQPVPGRPGTFRNHDEVKVWNTATWQATLSLSGQSGLAWSPDGKRLATSSPNSSPKIWDAKTGEELLKLAADVGQRCMRWSPDGKRLAMANRLMSNHLITICDVATGDQLLTLRGSGGILALEWSPDSRRLASALGEGMVFHQIAIGQWGTIRVWEMATGQEVLTLHGHQEHIAALAWSPDGKRLASGSWDGQIMLWDAAVRGSWEPSSIDFSNRLAWSLVTKPTSEVGDRKRALQLARDATRKAPSVGAYWNTLGVAQYRAGEWKDAVESLEKSLQLGGGGNSSDFFFLAMAHWHLGDKEKAAAWHQKGVDWMDKNMPGDEELLRFRAEAAVLLGIKEAPPADEKKAPTPKP